MIIPRILFVTALLLAPIAFAQSQPADHGLAATTHALDALAKSNQAAMNSITAGDRAGLIPKATVTRLLALTEKISDAQKQVSNITHGAAVLTRAQQAAILSILYPIVSTVGDGAGNGIDPITDKNTKAAVKAPFQSIQAALSSIQNALAGGAGVTYVRHERGEAATVEAALEKNGWANCGPALTNKCLPVATGPGLLVGYRFRSKMLEPEAHEDSTETDYVVAGKATLVTGGTIVAPRMLGNGEIKGSDIQGGQTFHLSRGDVIVIPAGTPHWFKEITEPINYFMVHQTLPGHEEK